MSVGTAENLAEILENSLKDIVLKNYIVNFTLGVLSMDSKIGFRILTRLYTIDQI